MLLFSALLYWRGEQVAYGFRHFATRLAAKRGDAAVILAGQAIRAVALGVVVTPVEGAARQLFQMLPSPVLSAAFIRIKIILKGQ